jgi:alcohol dehydrogenase (cytochrome c)
MRSTLIRRPALGLTALAIAGLLIAACSSNPTSEGAGARPLASASWSYPNGDLANTRDAAGSAVSLANVAKLKLAWTFKLSGTAASSLDGTGSLVSNPVVAGGLVYIQDLYSNVYALSLVTGKLKWEYTLNEPALIGPGPNGVVVAGGTVYGDSPRTAFALSAATGKVRWVDHGLLHKGQGSFAIQPQAADGRVYLGSAYGSGPGGGVLFALDAATGRMLWSFNTVQGPDPGAQVLKLGAGGAWQTPLVGTDGSVTFGTGNPYQSIGSAIKYPDRLLYTDSEVNLDAATGKLRWYYQAVPDDFKDYDMQASPIAASIGGTGVVLGAGKMGYVYAMNAGTGKLVWKTPVGRHDGRDNDSLLLTEHRDVIKLPYTYEPGPVGGVLTNIALAGDSVYVATVDFPFTFKKPGQVLGVPAGAPTGEVECLNLATGKVEWDTKVPSMPLGAVTVSNDLVFTTLYSGELVAFNRSTGTIVHQQKLPTSANAPIAIAGNTIIVPAGGPTTTSGLKGNPQLVAYTVPRANS